MLISELIVDWIVIRLAQKIPKKVSSHGLFETFQHFVQLPTSCGILKLHLKSNAMAVSM